MRINFIKNVSILLMVFSSLAIASTNKIQEKIPAKLVNFQYEDQEEIIFNFDNMQNLVYEFPVQFIGEYFLVRSGLKSFDKSNKQFLTYYEAKDKKLECQKSDFYDDFETGDNQSVINNKLSVLKECLHYRVKDLNGTGLDWEADQKFCEITRVDENTASFTGTYCFFKIKQGQKLSLDIVPNKECSKRDFLASKNISPMDLLGQMDTHVYPESEVGRTFTPLESRDKRRIFININPGRDLFDVFDDYTKDDKRYSRPATWRIPDLQISDLNIVQTNSFTKFELNLLTSTHSSKGPTCNSGVCSGVDYFDTPVAPELIIYGFDRRGKRKPISSTFVGGRVPGRWSGIFSLNTIIRDLNLEAGEKYEFELTFSDPRSDFSQLQKSVRSKIDGINASSNFSEREVGRDTFGSFNALDGLSGLGALPELNDYNMFDGINSQLKGFLPAYDFTFADKTFPPEYELACNSDLTNCRKARKDAHLVLSITAKVKEIKGSRVIFDDEVIVERKSELLSPYKKTLNKLPKLRCR